MMNLKSFPTLILLMSFQSGVYSQELESLGIIDGVYISELRPGTKCYTYPVESRVNIKFQNKTGYTIDTLNYYGNEVFNLLPDSISPSFTVQDKYKKGDLIFGKIQNLQILQPFILEDKAGSETIRRGLIVEIVLVDCESKPGFKELRTNVLQEWYY